MINSEQLTNCINFSILLFYFLDLLCSKQIQSANNAVFCALLSADVSVRFKGSLGVSYDLRAGYDGCLLQRLWVWCKNISIFFWHSSQHVTLVLFQHFFTMWLMFHKYICKFSVHPPPLPLLPFTLAIFVQLM